MKVAYIAGAYRGDGMPDTIYENITIARSYAKKYWQMGYAVFCPHMNTAFMDGACEDEIWLSGALEIMRRCDVLILLPGWEKSSGSVAELKEAERLDMEIVYA